MAEELRGSAEVFAAGLATAAGRPQAEPGSLGDHVLIMGPAGAGMIAWARHQATRIPYAERSRCESAAEYLHTAAGLGEQWREKRPAFGEWRAAPFRAPHHTVSRLGLSGRVVDGWKLKPGEASLAHGGVLMLHEGQEFSRLWVEDLVHIVRAKAVRLAIGNMQGIQVPAEFRLIVACSPCPCGYQGREGCKCTPEKLASYVSRLAPLLELVRVVPASVWQAEAAELQKAEARA